MRIITIGKAPHHDVVIDDYTVSDVHCQLISDDQGNCSVIDLNSSTGTYVNNVRREGMVALSSTDTIRIGNTELPWQSYIQMAGHSNVMATPATAENFTQNNEKPINYAQQTPDYGKPGNVLVWAILCTIFCCQPFGIVSIVYAAQINSRWDSGDYAGAYRAAEKARSWAWWGFGIGLVVGIFYTIVMIMSGEL